MNLFETLIKEQRPTDYSHSKEAQYFAKNGLKLASYEPYRKFASAAKPFDVIRANILLRALANKEIIEKEFFSHTRMAKKDKGLPLNEFMENVLSALPYFKCETIKNYVPIFPESIASLYSNDYQKLISPPYKRLLRDFEAILIDPFDVYGPKLFDSYFTSLAKIYQNDKGMAFYDFDANRIYFLNHEGRLDDEIALFDKGLENPTKSHLTSRILPVVEAYFAYDRDKMIKALVDGNLISSSLMRNYLLKREN